jgi:hypothetical protein
MMGVLGIGVSSVLIMNIRTCKITIDKSRRRSNIFSSCPGLALVYKMYQYL